MNKLNILSQKEIQCSFYSVIHYKVESPFPELFSERMIFGIDPGTVNFGLAKVWRSYINLYQISMDRADTALKRVLNIQYVLSDLVTHIDYKPIVMIEGASYGSAFRQVELAEVRTSAMLWFHEQGAEVRMEVPQKIRKLVFGDGRKTAEEEWELKDAGSALACAMYILREWDNSRDKE